MAGHIEKRGENAWRVTVFLGTDPLTGKDERHRKTIHGNKKDAERYMTAVLRERDMGRFAEPSKMTLAQYLDKWLQEAVKPKARERTFDGYAYAVKKYIVPRLGPSALEKLNPLAVQGFYNGLTEAHYAPKTVRNIHVILHAALKQAVRWRLLTFNPAADVELPKRSKRSKRAQALDSTQAGQFISAARQEPRGIAYLVGLATGMRPGEFLALTWPDIELKTGTVRVQRTIFWPRGGGWRFEDLKTEGSRRTIILPGALLPMLREHRARQAEQRLQLGAEYEKHDLVFATELGKPLDMDNLRHGTFRRILKAAGLPETLRPYDLRHSCATLLLEAGESLKGVSERLGHASITITADVYTHVTAGMQQATADRLNEVLFS